MFNKYIARNKEKTAYRIIDGEAVVVNLDNSTFHIFNSLATFIWQQADGKTTINQIIEKVIQEFEVEQDVAEKDCLEFLDDLIGKNLVTTSLSPLEDV